MKQTGLFPEPPPEWVFADEADLQVARVGLNIPVDTAFDYLVPDLFRGKVQPGIYQRELIGRNIAPVFIFVKTANYKRRFDFYGLSRRVADAELRAQVERAISESSARLAAKGPR